ncbi:tRNA pseudouridine synthase-like 1 [Podarcis raffonei]|uniref:tRNA pseudouridine synthase-like 1 n=1 Tax=Podarcis raffonei TaxID=65483 RepID=UPI002329972E|nr:tRNA pseudouridine synthase-like 1 [Podarcis raffonei]
MVCPKTRYLLFFQYLGTKYCGVKEVRPDQAVLGVQNHLEMAAEKLRHSTPSKFTISSRTDSGVHALCNAAHLDIERSDGKPPFTVNILTDSLNHHLKPEPIRILGARSVPSTFHARFSARSRTYVYRVATGCSHHLELPVFERNRCWSTYRGHLNPLAMQEAASFLLGTHDFSTFRSASAELPKRDPVKSLSRVEVRPAPGFLSEHSKDSHLRFWEMEFTAPSFLYKQVRRMVGVLVSVGQGHLEPCQVQRLLEIRDLMAYPNNTIAPPDGLFLKDVEYCEADLEISEAESEWQPN